MTDKYDELLDEIDVLKRQRADMAEFLIQTCRHSDQYWSGARAPAAEGLYQRARLLIRAAGFSYEPEKSILEEWLENDASKDQPK